MLERRHTTYQIPESPTATLTWHASKHEVYEQHHRSIPNFLDYVLETKQKLTREIITLQHRNTRWRHGRVVKEELTQVFEPNIATDHRVWFKTCIATDNRSGLNQTLQQTTGSGLKHALQQTIGLV